MKSQSNENLMTKYGTQGPRYTSYPPVPFWTKAPTEKAWFEQLKENYDPSQGLDLYVHIPFCESLCYYCGCNRVITKNHDHELNFVETLLNEWKIYQDKLGFAPNINSLHLGGGTPTFLKSENLHILLTNLLRNKTENFIGSVEIDPRTCTSSHLEILIQHNIFRASLGIQDFNQSVQEAIHRFQSPQMIKVLIEKMRAIGFKSINFDLIYGLPKQTKKTIIETIDHVLGLKPDMIAFYSYAHLPEKIKNQKLIKENDLPHLSDKRMIYDLGKELLTQNGYHDIGMDHFALESNFLLRAKRNNQLHRNFMGYVDKKSSILIGLGPSSISDSSKSFIQNFKTVSDYQKHINNGDLAIEKGHELSPHDLKVQAILQKLLCHGQIDLRDTHEIPFRESIEKELGDFFQDGLLTPQENGFEISKLGEPFVRNMAMSFDFHLRGQRSKNHFSQTI